VNWGEGLVAALKVGGTESEICGEGELELLALPETDSEICGEGETAGLELSWTELENCAEGELLWPALPEVPGLSVILKEFVWNGLKVSWMELEICGEDEAAGLKLFCTVWETCEVADPEKLWLGEFVSEIRGDGELELLALPETVSEIFMEGELELLALPETDSEICGEADSRELWLGEPVSEIRGEGEGVPLKVCGEAVGNGEKVSSRVSVICEEAETDAAVLGLAAAVPVLSCVGVAVFRAVRV
jgi:hypothetical protein